MVEVDVIPEIASFVPENELDNACTVMRAFITANAFFDGSCYFHSDGLTDQLMRGLRSLEESGMVGHSVDRPTCWQLTEHAHKQLSIQFLDVPNTCCCPCLLLC